MAAGGPRRQDSARYAFRAVSAGSDVVVVHDAARPLASADLIARTIAAEAIARESRRRDAAGCSRVGTGYDLHRLVEGRPLVLGGVTIPFERGLLGHSDADAVCHAATDAVLGAVRAGDIGRHFPDTDPEWRGASSLDLLRRAAEVIRTRGYVVVNLDVVVIAERDDRPN